jgi:hypothetical protein
MTFVLNVKQFQANPNRIASTNERESTSTVL